MAFLRSKKSESKFDEYFDMFSSRITELYRKVEHVNEMSIRQHALDVEVFLKNSVYENPKYRDSKRLNRHEYQVFSQFGEDGIINEIFNRIGTTNQFFVEFGVENGTETNTTRLLLNGWSGLWIEGDKNHVDAIQKSFEGYIAPNNLCVLHSFITAENIEQLFEIGNVPKEIDLLSIDIDRNDYHIWKSIVNYKPRVVVIEYNAIYRPGDYFVVPYDANATWDGSSHFGASLQAYCNLGIEKGYKLVGCTYSGVNAFFIREDLVSNLFESPYSAENHYEPPRYYLYKKDGHYRKIVL